MGFESAGNDRGYGLSPGGFEFGVQGFTYGPPVPKSITFFLDNSAMVCDQYGRHIRRAVSDSGGELRFADTPPEANKDGDIVPRPQFATHVQVVEALKAERIDWTSYEVRWRDKSGNFKVKGGMTLQDVGKMQLKLIQEGNLQVTVDRTIACAGWPQLPYAQLKELRELPPTPTEELRKIRDHILRKDALRMRADADAARTKELAATAEE